jgi:hypothetical protein
MASVGAWTLELDDVAPEDSTDVELELSIVGDDFDISANIASVAALEQIARAIESSEDEGVNVTAKERCFANWTVADLFVFSEECRLTFLLLGQGKRFRMSVPVARREDFLTALSMLKQSAEELE